MIDMFTLLLVHGLLALMLLRLLQDDTLDRDPEIEDGEARRKTRREPGEDRPKV